MNQLKQNKDPPIDLGLPSWWHITAEKQIIWLSVYNLCLKKVMEANEIYPMQLRGLCERQSTLTAEPKKH